MRARTADLYWSAGGFVIASVNALESVGISGSLWALAAFVMLVGFVTTAVRLIRTRNLQRPSTTVP